MAGIKQFNAKGGLDGRRIVSVGFKDDGFSPETDLTDAEQLVEADHVFAVVPFQSEVATDATTTFLAAHHTPFVGYAVIPSWASAPKWGFGFSGFLGGESVEPSEEAEGIVSAMKDEKDPSKIKMAIVGLTTVSDAGNRSLHGIYKWAGMDVVYDQTPIAVSGTVNYSPYTQAIIASGANAVFMDLDAAHCAGMAASLKAAGFKGEIFNGVTYYPGQLQSQANEAAALDGTYTVSNFPVDENNTPGVKAAEKALKSEGQPPYLTIGASVGYWSASVFIEMLQATLTAAHGNAAAVTPELFATTVSHGFAYHNPLPGGIGNEYFPAATVVPTPCRTVVKQVGTSYQEVTPYVCGVPVNIETGVSLNRKTGKPLPKALQGPPHHNGSSS